MKTLFALTLLGACTQAADAVVQLPFARRASTALKHASTERIAATERAKPRAVNMDLFLGAMTYVVNASVGTPGQPVSLVLSTSTSTTWVIDTTSTICSYYSYYYDDDGYSGNENSVCKWGSFLSNVSSTFKMQSPRVDDSSSSSSYDFSDSYSDGTWAYGDYFNDEFALGEVVFDNFTLGLVNSSDRFIGALGIGYNDSTTPTFTDRLVDQGLINSTAYSIWVDDAQASSGNLLFGAVDTTKFEGSLSRLTSYYSGYMMLMPVSSINATKKDSTGPISITISDEDDDSYSSSSSSSSSPSSSNSYYMFTATLSPPDTLSILPSSVVSQIWDIAGASYDSSVGAALIGCNAGNDASTTFAFRLGKGPNGPNITVALEDLIIPVTEVDTTSYFGSISKELCLFGVQNGSTSSYYTSSSSNYNLGSSLLRRTYSVFDFVNDEVAVAPVKFGATEMSHIVPFATYGASAPSSTLICAFSSCYDTDSSHGTSSGSESDGDGGLPAGVLSVPALIGTTLGVGVGALFLGLVGFLIWRHRRNKSLAGTESGPPASSAEAEQLAPMLPPQGPAAAAATAPDMTQASHPGAADKGKARDPHA